MIHVDYDGAVLSIDAPSRLTNTIAKIPGTRAVRGADRWLADPNWITLQAIGTELADLDGFSASDAAANLIDQYLHHESVVREWKTGEERVAEDRLYGYQHAGAGLLQTGPFMLLDEMGTGKTVMALTAARHVGGAVLVVAPNSMKHRWAREAATWYPEAASFVIEGSAAQKRKTLEDASNTWMNADRPVLVVVNWESLRTLTRLSHYGSTARADKEKEDGPLNEIDWNVVIADEAHRAKDPKSKQTRALWAVSQGARYRWALTGTPVLNTPGDLWAIGRFYDPATFGDARHKWHNYYVDFIETQWGPKDIGLRRDRKKVFTAWFDLHTIRRTKDEVLDLPPITYQVRELEMAPKQKAAYNRMVTDMIALIDGEILAATDPLVLLGRLSQIASATPVVEDMEVVALDVPSNKITALLEIIDEMEEGKQLAVFAQSRKLIELAASELARKGIDSVQITGAVDAFVRDMYVEKFQAGEVPVALCTMAAGSEGIDLYAADTAVFLQRSYSYGHSQQAESRIHRNGQEADRVTVIDLVSKYTVDEAVLSALQSKAGMSEDVLRDQARQLLGAKA